MQTPTHIMTYISWKQEKEREITRMRERKSRDLEHVRCINSNVQKLLVKDNDIKKKKSGVGEGQQY